MSFVNAANVNFCNLPGERNIFTNVRHKEVRENFEHTMALFQEKGVIFRPQPKEPHNRLSLVTVPPIDSKQLFEPRIYRKRQPAFMMRDEIMGVK
ncbi:MAG: hypothetical protein IKZ62_03865 [Prevotella sp.]|nr:hypothetical protein [Prevotella sp.]